MELNGKNGVYTCALRVAGLFGFTSPLPLA